MADGVGKPLLLNLIFKNSDRLQIVVILFWILKSIDMKLLGITEEFENYVPPFLDHAWVSFLISSVFTII